MEKTIHQGIFDKLMEVNPIVTPSGFLVDIHKSRITISKSDSEDPEEGDQESVTLSPEDIKPLISFLISVLPPAMPRRVK